METIRKGHRINAILGQESVFLLLFTFQVTNLLLIREGRRHQNVIPQAPRVLRLSTRTDRTLAGTYIQTMGMTMTFSLL